MTIYNPACQTYSPTVKVDFQKVDTYTGGKGKWLIPDTERRKDNELQSLKLPCRIYSSWVARCDMKESDDTMLNPICVKTVQGKKTSWDVRDCRTQNT